MPHASGVLVLAVCIALLVGAGETLARHANGTGIATSRALASTRVPSSVARSGAVTSIQHFEDLLTPWSCVGETRLVTMNRVQPTTGCNVWQPAYLSPTSMRRMAWPNGGGIFETRTPYGPGFRVVVTPSMTAPWGGKQAWLVDVDHLTPYNSFLGTVEEWSGAFMLPSAGNRRGFPRDWHAGVLWEWHTETMSGNHFAIDGWSFKKPRLRFGAARPDGGYDFTFSSRPLRLDHWYPWSIKIKWSYEPDGFVDASIGSELRVHHVGATLKAGERPYLQFGYYSVPRLRNEVVHAAIAKAESPATPAPSRH